VEEPTTSMSRRGYESLIELVEREYGGLRAVLLEVEVERALREGCSEVELERLLCTAGPVVGAFFLLSAIRRSGMRPGEIEQSLEFLFARHRVIADILSREVREGARILEVGCGRGLNLCELALRGYEAYGVDVSEEALTIAETLARRLGCEVRLNLVKGTYLPFENHYFDAVLYVWTLHEMDLGDIDSFFKEARRVLREGGALYVVDQEEVAPLDYIHETAVRQGFRREYSRRLLRVYDHGRASSAVICKYVTSGEQPRSKQRGSVFPRVGKLQGFGCQGG